jgi:nanoRNase/pAp phosphatase (c-di-AMP/oligoRNAs hydrolase)
MNFNKILYDKSKNISEDFDFNKVKHHNTDDDALASSLALKSAIKCF